MTEVPTISMDWVLYDRDLRHETVNLFNKIISTESDQSNTTFCFFTANNSSVTLNLSIGLYNKDIVWKTTLLDI